MTHHPNINGVFAHRNYTVLNVNGDFLSFTSPYRIKQLMKQGKVDVVDDFTVKLRYDFKTKPPEKGIWKLKHEMVGDREVPEYNCCVVCGGTSEFTKHHIVPKCYTRHFPRTLEMNLRLYYLIAMLCPMCHEYYETRTDNNACEFKKEITKKYFPFNENTHKKMNRLSGESISYFITLNKNFKAAMNLRERINVLLDGDDFEEVLLMSLSFHRENSDFYKLIVENIDDLDEFIEVWKQHFLDTMKPKHLSSEFDLGRKQWIA